MLRRLNKPAYLFRPQQALRRLRPRPRGVVNVHLPWGGRMEVAVDEAVGAGIVRSGVHELAVTETMWRLIGREDLAVDVGANAGYFTLLMARRAAEVIAFEPNPELLGQLRRNLERETTDVRLIAKAVSDSSGRATLHRPADYGINRGTATLEAGAGDGAEVDTVTLDDVLAERPAGVIKLDVEGHEAAALRGAGSAIERQAIRDVIFEEHGALPTAASELLAAADYSIFAITSTFRGPRLAEPDGADFGWDAPTYLATADPARAVRLTFKRGWHSLRPGRR